MSNVGKCLFALCAFVLIWSSLGNEDHSCIPSQIRLSLGDLYSTVSRLDDLQLPNEKLNDNQAYLVWQSQDKCEFAVHISDVDDAEKMIGPPSIFCDHYLHNFAHNSTTVMYHSSAYTALIHGLEYERSYQYTIINTKDEKSTGPFTFMLTTPNITATPKEIILAGDTDITERGNMTLNRIRSEIKKKPNGYAAWLHLGDIAYNLEDDNAKRGEDFFNAIQDITTSLPFVMTPGNHDSFDHYKLLNLRLRNPLFNTTHNQYFSFNLQGIHFVSINFGYYSAASEETQQHILDWISADFEQANSPANRALWPWIVVIAHNPIYCVYVDPEDLEYKKCYNFYSNFTEWDELFHKYSVDLMVSGHVHSYERMTPIYKNQSAGYTKQSDDRDKNYIQNPEATVYIVEGDGGNGYYSTDLYTPEGYTVAVHRNPGYGTLSTSENDSGDKTLTYQHYSSETGEIVDFMHLTRTKNAPVTKNDSEAHGNPSMVLIISVVAGLIGLVVAIFVLKKCKFGKIEEDKVPLNGGNSPMRSNKLRYNRPGERGLSMIDL